MTENIQSVNLVTEMKSAYGDYAMAVLLGRAIPNLYDGMKPVHRRILAAMKGLNLRPEGKFIKSARVEGEVMGKYHPHGSSYGAMVTLAAPHNNNIPTIDGHGNWGSSVDPAASSRYTECKLSPFSWECLLQGSETWETRPNYDGSLQEPMILDVSIPYVLVNGQEGIGVGFATHILPHNLKGLAKAIQKIPQLDSPKGEEILDEIRQELIPDFPTGCTVVADENLTKYLRTGSGGIRCRAHSELGVRAGVGRAKSRPTVTFTKFPPGLNPEKFGDQIKNALEKGSLEGVAEVIDESDRDGDRVTVVGKPGAKAEILRDSVYGATDADTRISAKTLVIDGTKPVELSPAQILARWVDWRMDRLQVQFQAQKEIHQKRLHIVEGLIRAISILDEVISLIRASADRNAAKTGLMAEPFSFSEEQANAILEMRLRQLTNLDDESLRTEGKSLEEAIGNLTSLIEDDKKRMKHLTTEVRVLASRYGNDRRSEVEAGDTSPSPAAPKGVPVKRVQKIVKPKFVKVDEKKGIVNVVKGPRGAIILEPGEKLVVVSSDDMVRKLPHSFKGAISDSPVQVHLVAREAFVKSKNYLVVFRLGEEIRALTIAGDKLCSTTAKGKRIIPEGAELIQFGGDYQVHWINIRKKAVTISPDEKGGSPGGRGRKVGLAAEIAT
jgi:DNA gyrase subunit A